MFSKALIALLVSAVSVSAAPGLSLKTAGPTVVDGVQNLKVVTTVTNTGDETLKLLKDPRCVLSGAPTHSFTITNAVGSSPDFRGIAVKYVPSTVVNNNKDSSFTVLSPCQSIDVTHELGSAYDFTNCGPGSYTFEASNLFHYVNENGDIVGIRADNHPTGLSLSGVLSNIHDVSHPISRSTRKRATFNGCSSEQQGVLDTAVDVGQGYATDANEYAESLTESTDRYNTWFGAWDIDRAATIKSHFSLIASNDFSDFTYDCTCNIDNYSDTYAYVYPDQFGTITLCGAFWNAAESGTDSQGGTIVHEASHFDQNGGTRDFAYGQDNCKTLAQDDPGTAVTNADSHEFFAENTPFLS